MATALETMQLAHAGKGCLGKAKPDEPVFVLRAQDIFAPNIVRAWAYDLKNIGKGDTLKFKEALQLAEAMEIWAVKNGSKCPD